MIREITWYMVRELREGKSWYLVHCQGTHLGREITWYMIREITWSGKSPGTLSGNSPGT